jgi:sensor histidine kinase regulating citrate/malate metabolism
MPDAVKLQVFKRSFSTKGEGRGLGTYSIKLFTENYLGGAAELTSNEVEGTTFWVKLDQAEGPSPSSTPDLLNSGQAHTPSC